MKCSPCTVGQHDYCARRADVDLSAMDDATAKRELGCECDCEAGTALAKLTERAELVKAGTGGEMTWPTGMSLAERLDALADQVALVPPATPTERTEVGNSLARYMLAARDGETARQVVRRIVEELGWAEAMSVAETVGDWALAIAVESAEARKAGRK